MSPSAALLPVAERRDDDRTPSPRRHHVAAAQRSPPRPQPPLMATPLVQRLLDALEYPFPYAGDAAAVSKLVSWVEDRKIRLWEIERRKPFEDCWC